MSTYTPWPFLTDIADVALAAALWQRGCFHQQHVESLSYPHNRGLRVELLMAGIAEVQQFVDEFSFQGEVIDLLRDLPVLADVPDEFWDHISTGDWPMQIWALDEGAPFHTGEVCATLSGGVGAVVLYRAGAWAILSQMIREATLARTIINDASAQFAELRRKKPDFAVTTADLISRRSVGHGWSHWSALAMEVAGCTPIPHPEGFTYVMGSHLEGYKERLLDVLRAARDSR